MIIRLALIAAAAAFVSASAVAQEPPAAADDVAPICKAHGFETTVDVPTASGVPRKSKVRICGQPGQSNADWVRTLRDTIAKVNANKKMPSSVKSQIVTAIDSEIARLERPSATAPASTLIAIPSPIAQSTNPSPAARSPLAAQRGPYAEPEYTTFKPLPEAKPAETASATQSAVKPVPRLAAPRLTFRCLDPNAMGAEGPCNALNRDTLITVRAQDNVPGGTSLRFMRRSDDRGEVELAMLRKGQSMRMALPSDVCRGVAGSRVTIDVVRRAPNVPATGQVVDTLGPYELNCQ